MYGQKRKPVWCTLFLAFVGAILTFGYLVHLLSAQPNRIHPPDPVALRPILYSLAGIALAVSAVYASVSLPKASTPARFQTGMILALALGEAACIFGLLLYFLGGAAGEFLRFQVGTLVVYFVFILPHILRRRD